MAWDGTVDKEVKVVIPLLGEEKISHLNFCLSKDKKLMCWRKVLGGENLPRYRLGSKVNPNRERYSSNLWEESEFF